MTSSMQPLEQTKGFCFSRQFLNLRSTFAAAGSVFSESLVDAQALAEQTARDAGVHARKATTEALSGLLLLTPILFVSFLILLCCRANSGMVARLLPVFGFAVVLIPLSYLMMFGPGKLAVRTRQNIEGTPQTDS